MTYSRRRFSEQVRLMRDWQGWTIGQLVAVLPSDWTHEQIVRIEAGEYFPPPKIRRILISILDSSWASKDGRRRRWWSWP